MKKFLFVLLAVAGSVVAAQAQQFKVGVFDIDIMVQAMPGYDKVDSMVQVYERDSLQGEYDYNVREYNRLDSTYKADSAAKAPASVLNFIKTDRSRIATQIVYWQQIAQQKTEGKRQELAGPLYEKVLTAYSNVLKAKNYNLVLKPGSYELGSKVDNIFELVGKELKIELPAQLRSQGAPAEEEPAKPKPAAGNKPAPKKN
jgi:Skp family chaperone for outer membrane proteins